MAERRRQSAAKSAGTSRKITVPFVQANDYRVAAADGINVTALVDGKGAALQVSFTRRDNTPTAETFLANLRNGEIRRTGQKKFEGSPRKVVEFGVMLRPDHALEIATTIFRVLDGLSDEIQQRYGIQKLDVGIEKREAQK